MHDMTTIDSEFENKTTDELIAWRQRLDAILAARRQALSEQLAKLGEMTEAKPRRRVKQKRHDDAD